MKASQLAEVCATLATYTLLPGSAPAGVTVDGPARENDGAARELLRLVLAGQWKFVNAELFQEAAYALHSELDAVPDIPDDAEAYMQMRRGLRSLTEAVATELGMSFPIDSPGRKQAQKLLHDLGPSGREKVRRAVGALMGLRAKYGANDSEEDGEA